MLGASRAETPARKAALERDPQYRSATTPVLGGALQGLSREDVPEPVKRSGKAVRAERCGSFRRCHSRRIALRGDQDENSDGATEGGRCDAATRAPHSVKAGRPCRRCDDSGLVAMVGARNGFGGGYAVLTRDELVTIMPRAGTVADQVIGPLDAAMTRFEIQGATRQAAFLAQLAHESGEFRHWSESLNYSWPRLRQIFPKYFKTDAEAQAFDRQQERIANRVYGGRMGNGPEASGDGWRYRGRGPIQLTGKDNYRACGRALGVDLLGAPELLETPEIGCLAAAWFWTKRGLNALADNGDFVEISRRINGGLIGLEERRAFWARAKSTLGIQPEPAMGVEAGPVPSPRLATRGSLPPAALRPRKPAGPRANAGGRKLAAARRKSAQPAAKKSRTVARPAKAGKRAFARVKSSRGKRIKASAPGRRHRGAHRRSDRRR
jgi:putative chitinase